MPVCSNKFVLGGNYEGVEERALSRFSGSEEYIVHTARMRGQPHFEREFEEALRDSESGSFIYSTKMSVVPGNVVRSGQFTKAVPFTISNNTNSAELKVYATYPSDISMNGIGTVGAPISIKAGAPVETQATLSCVPRYGDEKVRSVTFRPSSGLKSTFTLKGDLVRLSGVPNLTLTLTHARITKTPKTKTRELQVTYLLENNGDADFLSI